MRVLMVWDGNFPWDVRVEKILDTLNAWGHETHLVCRNSNAKPRRELHRGTQLRRLFAFGSGPLRKLNGLINFPAFFSPLWRAEIRRAIREIEPDVVIIRDLPIAPAVIPFAKAAGVPTILDMAECYPELIRCVWKFDRFNLLNVFVRNPYLADRVERHVVHNVDLIWVMIEESAQRLQRMGVPSERLVKVSNTPAVASMPTERRAVRTGGALSIVYVGLINPSRGVDTVVDAAAVLRRQGIDFSVKIVGSGKALDDIRNRVRTLGVGDRVELTGWIDHKEVQGIIAQCDVGLVPHHDCSHWNNTIPNKLFDYMKAGIPVLVSDVKPAARIVNATGCGLVFRSGDSADLAAKLTVLADAQERARMGDAGRAAVLREFNWETDSASLKQSMAQLATG